MAEPGYDGGILRVDLPSRSTGELATLEYADRFLGGRGIAADLEQRGLLAPSGAK